MSEKSISRKKFLSYSALAAGSVSILPSLFQSCAGGGASDASSTSYTPLANRGQDVYIPDLNMDKAVAGRELKAGIIGCGSRGGGAANDFLNSADGISIIAMADIFPDRVESLRAQLKKDKSVEVSDDKIYYGFDAYKKLIDEAGVDMIIIATPTLFHPDHMSYAIEKGKHVFCEKPAAIDAVGTRKVLAACKQARAKGLSVVTGTQRHHDRCYLASYEKIRQGYIGEIISGNVYWNQGGPWFVKRKKEWTDYEYMLRDFFSWNWLCGDHVIDQLIHNVDVFTWMSHLKPVKAVGMGSRLQRTTGDVYDNFAIDIEYEEGVHCLGMARQIDDCDNRIGEEIHGTKGTWTSDGHIIKDLAGNIVWQYDFEAEKAAYKTINGYVQEHMNLINSIRQEKPICLAEVTAWSSLACNMGRESAYTGKAYLASEFLASDHNLMPDDLSLGNTDMSKFAPRLPGKSNG